MSLEDYLDSTGIVAEECTKKADDGMQDTTPWVLVKEDKEQCGALVNACAGLCALLAALVEPYMPSITQKVASALYQGWNGVSPSQSFSFWPLSWPSDQVEAKESAIWSQCATRQDMAESLRLRAW